ncbi:zinc-dependent metalloprotease [Ekhidna sp. To15]|uniref:zinc-dependent metalloprotease n=1 Tax=Ekhidna sp. To15 TaxID=3395267 RepID=UPI003F523DE8
MKRLLVLMFALMFVGFNTDLQAQKKKKKKGDESEQAAPKKSKNGLKSYSEVITDEAISDEGLIISHQVGDDFYFEIPADILGKEILIVSRIAGHVKGLNFGGAGMKSRPQQVIRFQKVGGKILMRSVSYNNVADEDEPIYTSVKNNNFEPIVESFSLETMKDDSSSYVIKVSDFFSDDIPMIGALRDSERKRFKIKGIDKSRSLITSVRSFPENVEVRHILTYRGDELPANGLTETLSIEMNQSMILLPDDPMVPRYHDERVGFFSLRQIDYSSDLQKAAQRRFITKWRLEPSDWDAYNRGEAVEPVKPIVYYIDPATPEKWRKYIKQGVEDWQVAFEAAGLKNAILAKDPPSKEEDPDWSPEDVRYSVIRYIATDIQNAQGPHVHDPRTGEILESDILWYHNVMNLLRNWYFIQTAAVNPEAQKIRFDDDLMGELIRFVAAHEVGHTLGYPHNMGSSPSYTVDQLRSKEFTDTHGVAPSIMDYARFNYVAQPEDGITNFFPRVGEYDFWVTQYGYKPIANVNSPDDEEDTLNEWIVGNADNPVYRYGQANGVDPTSQTEDIGHDAMIASELGIRNLKRITDKLMEWATEDGKNYDELEELYRNVINQFNRYNGHVVTNVGGVYQYFKTADQDGAVYTHVEKEKQQRAVKFLNEQLFSTPNWLVDAEILSRIQQDGLVDRMRGVQVRILSRLTREEMLMRLVENEALNGSDAYTVTNLFTDMRQGIWGELYNGRKIDTYRRNLQKEHIARLGELMNLEEDEFANSDIPSVAMATLNRLERDVRSGLGRQNDATSRFHLQDIQKRIDAILNPK